MPDQDRFQGWRSRGYLPHFDQPRLVQAITFRLHDSVPQHVVDTWKCELRWHSGLPATDPRRAELHQRIARYEDAGHGECWLRNPAIDGLVEESLLHFDSERYRLIAWCIMPNHVHVLLETFPRFPLSRIIHSWKSFTASAANQRLERTGVFWFREYHDRFIRDSRHLTAIIDYIEQNPVTAGLARQAGDWRWSSAAKRHE